MNTFVKNMVELLFKNVEETDEVRALRDEVLANCNAHYDDLIRNGVSEQDALRAVAESLQGMEEVVSQYPVKKNDFIDEVLAGVSEAAETVVKAAESVLAEVFDQPKEEEKNQDAREIRLEVKAWDVQIMPSKDGRVNVNADGERADLLDIRFDNGVLTVKEKEDARQPEEFIARFQNLKWDSFDGLMRSVRDAISGAIHSEGGTLTIEVPGTVEKIEHHSAAGDLRLENIKVKTLNANTASGDVDAELAEETESVRVHSAGGDIRLTANAQKAELESMSGDLCVCGAYRQLKASAVSGDVTCNAGCAEMKVSSVSGEVNVISEKVFVQDAHLQSTSGDVVFSLRDAGLRQLSIQTVSGDISATLALEGQPVHLVTGTMSGDVQTDVNEGGADAPVRVTAKTMSGDINVRSM